ncbi:MAG TPA: LuxR C-terminal-related transcriptional regulator [Blastococcus sp.]|jgi:DNA-binding CsgD family transcriptional regulator|nr:LuxR C-terminal-related transcriptional regulator [Blastococcus sp.]
MPTRDGEERARRAVLRAAGAGLGISAVQQDVLAALRRVMTVDAAFFATADPDTLLFTGAYAEEPLAAATAQFLDNEFGARDVNRFATLAAAPGPVGTLDVATHADRTSSARYRDIMRPLGLGDELRAALVVGGACWGYLCLHRVESPLGFTAGEAALVARLAPVVAVAVRSAVVSAGRGPGTSAEPGAGVVVLSEDLHPVAVTPEAQAWLELIGGTARRPDLPTAVTAVGAALLAGERGPGPTGPLTARVATAAGGWLQISASRLDGDPDGERRIAVVLAAAPAGETVPLLLTGHGLTPREAAVARLVLRGASTGAIVDTLHISRYTVQDHLKAVFDKVGVRSRRELAVRLLGQASAGQP